MDRGVGFDRHRDHDQHIARLWRACSDRHRVRDLGRWAIVLQIVGGILFWFIKKGFFWLIDVVPAKAESVAEAKEMVVGGPITWLGKKFLTDIHNWTEDDTEQFASLMNWRARLFFQSTERIRQRVWRFQALYEATGKQPGDLTEDERQKVVADLTTRVLRKRSSTRLHSTR
jgi:hypothetical protein